MGREELVCEMEKAKALTACTLPAGWWYMSYIAAEVQERVQEEVLEPNYYLLLFGTSVLNLHSALTSITPSNNLKSRFGAGRRFPNNIKVSPGLGDGSRKRAGVLGAGCPALSFL